MPAVIPVEFILVAIGGVVVGWLVTLFLSRLGKKIGKSQGADPRDGKIRSLEADLRVHKADVAKLKEDREGLEKKVREFEELLKISEEKRQEKDVRIDDLKKSLRDSVHKTRELRHELTEKASENIISEVMLREAKTELELAHASTDMISTGELRYDPPDEDDPK